MYLKELQSWCRVYKFVFYDPTLAVELSLYCPYGSAQFFHSLLNLASLDISHEYF